MGSEPPEPRLKYVLRKFPLVPAQESNPEPPAWKSGILPSEPPVLLMLQIKVVVFKKLYKFYIEHLLIEIIVFLIEIKNAIK